MQNLAKNRKGLSQVITTLIILVVAVLLAGVVTYYATNVVMTRTTQEEVRIRKSHVWVDEGDEAYAALMVQNLGGRDILIDKLAIRGVDCKWGPVTVEVTGEPVAIGDGATLIFNLDNFPVHDDSEVIYVDGVPLGLDTGYALDDLTGVITFVAPAPGVGVPITADYIYTNVMVKYYIVSAGEDVSDDFKLKEVTGEVFAQIGTIPALPADWLTPYTDIPLKSSNSILFFITDPTNIALHDVGTTISITVFTTNSQWIVETNVQAAVIEFVS